MIYQDELSKAKSSFPQNQTTLAKLRKRKPKDLDDRFHQFHEEVFEEIDCLECANCCKTTSPIFLQSDIERLSKSLKMKVPDFIEEYLKLDDERDYVLKQSPCAFLGNDNKCIVYESRPKACREYPHTNRKRMYQITNLTLKNTLICPAVSRIMEKINTLQT
ncbi:MAG: YkgJ family cysteine cluster protein [Cyclobacteriaceae bacterium]